MGGIGVGLILLALFLAVIAIRGTYKLLPPWKNTQGL